MGASYWNWARFHGKNISSSLDWSRSHAETLTYSEEEADLDTGRGRPVSAHRRPNRILQFRTIQDGQNIVYYGSLYVVSILRTSLWRIMMNGIDRLKVHSITATITPATSPVNAVITQSTTSMIVPYLDFDSNARHLYNGIGNRWLGMGQPISTISLRRLLSTVATGGHTLQVTPSLANSTFEIDFSGPSLKCFNLSAHLRSC